MRGVSANVMCGQEGNYGTSAFQTIIDEKAFENYNYEQSTIDSNLDEELEELYTNTEDDINDVCAIQNIKIENNAAHIVQSNMIDDDDYMPDF